MLSDSNFRKTTKCSFYKNFLAKRQVPSFPIQRVSQEFLNTTELVHATGFNKPFVVTAVEDSPTSGEKGAQNVDKLGIVLPSRDKDLVYVSEIVGPEHPVKIIEVGQQAEISDWTLGAYADYLTNYRADHHKVLNMITLEFSATPFNSKVQAPTFVRDLDWIDTIWPIERRARGDYPKVQKYCLAGMAGSYTDFHIDFGGTSVWYHVLSGQKRFYLVPPTTSNLKAFEKWTCSSAQSDVFFGDLLESPNQCFQFDLNPGETFMIPSGWIHAVYTPVDSLVFGGNFVHSYAILRQLQIYSIEHRTRVQKAYRFPFFRQINWYFLVNLLSLARAKYISTPAGTEPKPEVASWIKDMMGDDDDDEDEEAEVDDLQAACDNLKDPIVLYQLPYLVKTCEIWYKSGGGQEKSVFEVPLEDTGCGSVEEVLAEWWKVLFAIAEHHSVDDAASDAATAHVRHIQSQASLDLLDDAVVCPVFGSFERDLVQLLPAPVKPTVEAPVPKEEAAAEPLKLKFTFKRTAPAPAPASVLVAEPAPTDVAATRRSSVKQESISSANFLEELKKMQEAPPAAPQQPKFTLTHDASLPAVENPAPKKPIALKLTLGSKLAPKVVVSAPKEAKVVNTVSARAVRPPSERSVSASSTTSSSTEAADRSGGRRYGTRGLKLSKDFLNRAMDVDIGDYQEGSEDEAQRDDGEEEEYGESQGRFGQSHRYDHDESDRKSSRGGDFAFRERDEEEGGEWRSAKNADRSSSSSNRAAPAGTFLDSDEENSDDEMGSDAEEDFSDEDGFIVNDTARRGGQKRKAGPSEVNKAPLKKATPAPVAPAKPQYFVDRLSESHERNVRANAAALQQNHVHMASTLVPQIQGVRINTGKKPAAPVNNRAKIMKKLGFK